MALVAKGLQHFAIEEAERVLQLPRAAKRLLPLLLRVVKLVLALRVGGLACEQLCERSLSFVQHVDGEGVVGLNLLCDGGFVV